MSCDIGFYCTENARGYLGMLGSDFGIHSRKGLY